MAQFKTNTGVLYTKAESTAGTNSDPLDKANAYASSVDLDTRFRSTEVSVTQNFDNEDSKYSNGGDSGDEAIPTTTVADAKFDIKFAPGEFIRDSSNDTDNVHRLNYAKFLQSAGLDMVKVTDATVTDAANSYPNKYVFFPSIKKAEETVTQTAVYTNTDGEGKAMDIVGLMYNFSLTAGGTAASLTFSFDGQGQGNESYDISLSDMQKIGYDPSKVMDTIASRFRLTDVILTENVAGATPIELCTNSLTFEAGNEMYLSECQNTPTGISHNLISAKKPRLSINPKYKTVAEFDSYKALVEAKNYKVEVTINDTNKADGTPFTPFKLVIPRAQMISAAITDDNGYLREDIVLRPIENKESFIPIVNYYADADGSLTAYDFSSTDLSYLAYDSTYYFIVEEEHVATI